MRHLILSHFGLAKPYRFERTLLALAALALFVVLSVCGAWLWFRGGVSVGSLCWWYLIYVGALLLGVLCLVRLPRTAAMLLALATLEFGVGVGSLALYSLHIIPNESLAPTDSRRPTLQGTWHPLLQAVWMPTRPDQPHDISINSDGARGPERSAEELRGKIVVALFGGSSTFDSQPDGQSWPDRLQTILGERYAVINRGLGGYTTAEHLIQTVF
jgi:hypothetical protein